MRRLSKIWLAAWQTLPAALNAHPKIARLLKRREESVLEGAGIDWANAEALAFASLLVENVPVRLSGQDSRRGTFNQRHSTLVDQKTGQLYVPLAFLEKGQAAIQIYDSMLSEAAVLGLEYGYSLETPHGLTIWEAQFGDFANGAQVIIDQFIGTSGTKWDRSSGLVLFLPHGYEGQGPEHSNARIERFMNLCADDNMHVAYAKHSGTAFSSLAATMQASLSPAFDRLHPEKPVASARLQQHSCRAERRLFSGDHPLRHPGGAGRNPSALQWQNLLRTAGRNRGRGKK